MLLSSRFFLLAEKMLASLRDIADDTLSSTTDSSTFGQFGGSSVRFSARYIVQPTGCCKWSFLKPGLSNNSLPYGPKRSVCPPFMKGLGAPRTNTRNFVQTGSKLASSKKGLGLLTSLTGSY